MRYRFLFHPAVVIAMLITCAPLCAQPATLEPPALVQQLEDHLGKLVELVGPTTVSVEAIKPPKAGATGKDGRVREESGSGVIVQFPKRTGYYVLTNNHVISGAPRNRVYVQLSDGRILRPAKIWADVESDVAVMQLSGVEQLPTATLGDSDEARVGQLVMAVGSPFGLNQTVTQGIISASGRGAVNLGDTIRIKNFLQTDTAINPGSSGGPLFDMRGRVIAINTAIASQTGHNSGVAFSIPINMVKRVAQQLLEEGQVTRGFLGMQVSPSFAPEDVLRLGLKRMRGAWVDRVYPETPADTSGLRSKDVILQVEQVAIRNGSHLIQLISHLPPGQRIRMQVWRDRSVVTLEAVVGNWNNAQSRFRSP